MSIFGFIDLNIRAEMKIEKLTAAVFMLLQTHSSYYYFTVS